MMLLAIDTSTTLTGLACYDKSGLLAECSWHSGRNHTAQVMPQLHMLFRHMRRSVADVQAVAVALGPGSWSGLRVGMSIAKGMALAGGLTLLGVGTLDTLAYQHRHSSVPVVPIIRLGRDRFAMARFHYADDIWQRAGDYRNLSLSDLGATLTEGGGPLLLCGDLDSDVQEHLRRVGGKRAYFAEPAANLRRPGYLAELAWQRFAAGERDHPAHLEPLYLGEPVKPTTSSASSKAKSRPPDAPEV
jgi:tRNA threonylcarbamoyladenosine biosynthesis protein TsaB